MRTNPIANHRGQLGIWNNRKRFEVLVAGRRWGKTIYLRERMIEASEVPDADILYIAPTRMQAKDIMWKTLKQAVAELQWGVKINESELKIERGNGASIQLISAEKPGRIRGRGLSFCGLDEYAEYRSDEIWTQVVRPALSDKRGSACFAMSPKGFNHGHEIFNKAKVSEDWAAHTFKTIDSPFFQTPEGRKEVDAAKQNLSERDFRQEYEASFENFAGRVYYAFDRGTCSTDLDYVPGLPIIAGQDFNRSPMTTAFFQKHGDTLVQFDELFLQTSNTEEVCRVIASKLPGQNVIFRPDATGSRRTSNSSLSDHQIIINSGFSLQAAPTNPSRIDRWAAVNRAFEKGWVKINVKNCPMTVKDLEVICYKEGTCEPMLTNPMLGHIADGHGYAVAWEYPILGEVKRYAYV